MSLGTVILFDLGFVCIFAALWVANFWVNAFEDKFGNFEKFFSITSFGFLISLGMTVVNSIFWLVGKVT
jgi:hypothetical protein